MDDSLPLDPDRLLDHVAWVRRLAALLIRDPGAADDAAQETLLVALDRGPRDRDRPRAWLSSIVRSIARRLRRSDERRAARERAVARSEALPATDDLVLRAALLRAVVDAVVELPEPYRTTILLRFFEDVPARDIAARRGEPVETVRTRLKRGLAMLRERLAKELDVATGDGGRAKGLEALALLVEPVRTVATTTAAAASASSAAVITGGWLMTTMGKVTVLAALAVAAAVTTYSLTSRRGGRIGETSVANPDAPRANAAASPDRASTEAVITRDAPSENGSGKSGESKAPGDSTAVARPDPSRWSDVTKDSWQNLFREDDGVEIRAAITGLETESIDLVALLRFVTATLEASFIVPGAEEMKSGNGKQTVSWVEIYDNARNERSMILPTSTHEEKGDIASFMLPVNFWPRENAGRLGLPPSNLSSWFSIYFRRSVAGRITGQIHLDPGPQGRGGGGLAAGRAELEEMTAKLKKLNNEKRLPSDLQFDFTDGLGRRTWSRSSASQPLSGDECERLTALFELLQQTAKEVRDAASK